MLLMDLGLTPKNPAEQEEIAQIIDGIDADGSGSLSLPEFAQLSQRIVERLHRQKRLLENTRAAELGFKMRKTVALRRAFQALDKDNSGFLSLSEVERALQLMRVKVVPMRVDRILRGVDEDGNGELDFMEFMTLMSHIGRIWRRVCSTWCRPAWRGRAARREEAAGGGSRTKPAWARPRTKLWQPVRTSVAGEGHF